MTMNIRTKMIKVRNDSPIDSEGVMLCLCWMCSPVRGFIKVFVKDFMGSQKFSLSCRSELHHPPPPPSPPPEPRLLSGSRFPPHLSAHMQTYTS